MTLKQRWQKGCARNRKSLNVEFRQRNGGRWMAADTAYSQAPQCCSEDANSRRSA